MAAIDATLSVDSWSSSTQDGSPWCFLLDGYTVFAETAYDAKLDITNSFCICFRIKSNLPSLAQYVLSKPNDIETDNNWSVIFGYITNCIEFYAAGYSGATDPRSGSQITLPDTNWHAIAYRYDGTEWAYFFDGVKTVIDAAADFSLLADGTVGLHFGSFNGSANHFSGSLDHVRLYSTNLPTDAELEDWTASPFAKPISVAATGVWQFDEGTGTTAADSDVSPPAAVSLTASTASIAENGGTVSIIATLSATASATVTIAVEFAGGAATGSDYTLSTDTITIASGQTSGSITATAISDSIYEGSEQFTASITSVTGGGAFASAAASTSVVTIVDDDPPPTVSLTASTSSIAENAGTATITAILSATHSATTTVALGFAGTANSASDYSRTTTSISIASGQTSGSIGITAIQDALSEGNETIIVSIASVTGGASSSSNTLTVIIVDDDINAAIGARMLMGVGQ